MDQTQTDRIRARAHEIWEQEGRVEGSANEHWTRAQAEVLDSYGTGGPADIHDPLHVSEASYQEHDETDTTVPPAVQPDAGEHVPGSEHFPVPASRNDAAQRGKQAAIG